jgi:MFS family permease
VRYQVVTLTVLLGMVTYLDRVCISKLAPNIMADLSLSKIQMGYVFSAFALSYALFALPAARWADKVGTRLLLTLIVLWWSAFTIGTAAVTGLISLLAVRFLFGAGEAGAWPCVTKSFSHWIPRGERGTVQGIFFTGAHLTGGVTPLLVVWLSGLISWRTIFVIFGSLGFCWAAVWFFWFHDRPASHPAINRAEQDLIAAGQTIGVTGSRARRQVEGVGYWVKLLTHRNILALCLLYFPNSFVFYFCITWLPTYLKEKYNFDAVHLGFLAGLPLILSVFGDLAGGVVTDRVTARFGLRAGRCGVGGAAYFLAGVALLSVPFCPPVMAAILIAVGVAASMFTLAAAWSTCIDIGGDSAATVSALMNTAGQVGSFLCPLIVAYSLKWFGNNWDISIYLMGFMFLLGVVWWAMVDPRKHVFEVEESRI